MRIRNWVILLLIASMVGCNNQDKETQNNKEKENMEQVEEKQQQKDKILNEQPVYDEIQEIKKNIEISKAYLEKQEYEYAENAVTKAIEESKDASTEEKVALKSEAEQLLQEIENQKVQTGVSQENQSESGSIVENSKSINEEQATELVKQYVNNREDVTISFDHVTSNGDYIFQVFETIVVNEKTNETQSATMGWYGVNKQTKEVYEFAQ